MQKNSVEAKMHKNLYAALALIFIGAYLLLDNFNVINFSYKTILYVLGLIFGGDLILRFIRDRQAKHLLIGIAITGISLWLLYGLHADFWITDEEFYAVIFFIFAAAVLITALVTKQYRALVAILPLLFYALLLLNNLYYWYSGLQLQSIWNAGFGSLLLAVGLYYISLREDRTETSLPE
jgi:hypothetical protein